VVITQLSHVLCRLDKKNYEEYNMVKFELKNRHLRLQNGYCSVYFWPVNKITCCPSRTIQPRPKPFQITYFKGGGTFFPWDFWKFKHVSESVVPNVLLNDSKFTSFSKRINNNQQYCATRANVHVWCIFYNLIHEDVHTRIKMNCPGQIFNACDLSLHKLLRNSHEWKEIKS